MVHIGRHIENLESQVERSRNFFWKISSVAEGVEAKRQMIKGCLFNVGKVHLLF